MSDAAQQPIAPILSVIVPALQADLELQRCVDSIRLALPDRSCCEVVLVLPANRVDEALLAFPGERVVAETRPSVYGAMNDGVASSCGRYLYFVGKDDIVLPAARELLQLLAVGTPSMVFADVYWGQVGRHSTRSSRWAILFRNVCHQGIVYERAALLQHGPYVRRFRVRADQLLNIRMLWDKAQRVRVAHLKLPIAWYAADGLSSRLPDRVFYRVQPAIIRRYLGPVAGWLWMTYKKARPEKGMT